MSATGCGFPTEFAGERFACGTRLAGFGDVAAILCPACQASRRGLDTASSASRQHFIDTGEYLPFDAETNTERLRAQYEEQTRPCVNCSEPTTSTLCDPCAEEVRRDLAESDQPDPGEPGSRCTWRSCGYCGRCGGA